MSWLKLIVGFGRLLYLPKIQVVQHVLIYILNANAISGIRTVITLSPVNISKDRRDDRKSMDSYTAACSMTLLDATISCISMARM